MATRDEKLMKMVSEYATSHRKVRRLVRGRAWKSICHSVSDKYLRDELMAEWQELADERQAATR